MPHRLTLIVAVVVALVLAAATLAFASSGGGSDPKGAPSTTPAPARHLDARRPSGPHGGAMFGMVRRLVLKSVADRLDVQPAALRDGLHAVAEAEFARKATEAGLTDSEKSALTACHEARHAGAAPTRRAARKARRALRATTCDPAVIRPAIRKLKALGMPDLAALKTELSTALAAKLGITADKLLSAVRAELDQRLGQGVTLGFLTAAGKTQALACFDTPATCDLKTLRAQIRGHHGLRAQKGWKRYAPLR